MRMRVRIEGEGEGDGEASRLLRAVCLSVFM